MSNQAVLEKPAQETGASSNLPVVIRKEKPPLIPSPREITSKKHLRLVIHVGKDYHRSFAFQGSDSRRKSAVMHHIYPTLIDWIGRVVPDGVNPRSHDVDCLRSPVARAIEQTILDAPEDFVFANRGSTIIAERCDFDPKTGNVEIVISDPENQGLADGATTDAVIAKVQTRFARDLLERKDATFQDFLSAKDKKIPKSLMDSRIHVEVITGLDDRSRMANLVQGRNTSRQVKGWSMSDFRGAFDWIKKILDADDSMFKGKVGYEENSGKDITVLDVLSIITLFHPEWDQRTEGGEKAPVVAYANKGRMDARLLDENLKKGYEELELLIPDILRLHDYVYQNFEIAYNTAYGVKAKLGRREGVESRMLSDDKYELVLTGLQSNYVIPSGFVFPLLASLRALVTRRGEKVYWKVDPFKFFFNPERPEKSHGQELVAELMDQVDAVGGNPNVAGKRKTVYTAIHSKARIALNEDLEEIRESKAK